MPPLADALIATREAVASVVADLAILDRCVHDDGVGVAHGRWGGVRRAFGDVFVREVGDVGGVARTREKGARGEGDGIFEANGRHRAVFGVVRDDDVPDVVARAKRERDERGEVRRRRRRRFGDAVGGRPVGGGGGSPKVQIQGDRAREDAMVRRGLVYALSTPELFG